MKGRMKSLLLVFALLFTCFMVAGEVQNIQFTPDLSIKSSEAGDHSPLDVSWVEADSKGNLYILDRHNQRIIKFDESGKYRQTIGREGQRPGELESPSFLVIDSMGYLYVHDMVKKALVVYDDKGNFIRNAKYADTDIFLLLKVMIDPQSNIICGYCPISAGRAGDEYRISRFDRNFQHMSDIYIRRDVFLRKEVRRGSVVFSLQAPPYTPRVHWTMDSGGRFYINYSSAYRIKVFSGEGQLEDEIRRDSVPKAITPAETALIRAKYGGSAGDFIDLIPFPKVKPPVRGLFIVEGFLFVQRDQIGKQYSYDIFDRSNVYLGTMALDFAPFLNKNGCIYTFNMGGELDTGDPILTELTRYTVKIE